MNMLNKIKYISRDKGLSIRKIELDLGFPNNTIGRWEKNNPSIDRVLKVADYLDVSIDYLVSRTDKANCEEKEAKVYTLDEALDQVIQYNGKKIISNDKDIIIINSLIKAYLINK